MPVRFSCNTAVIAPSASSAAWKRRRTREKNRKAPSARNGIRQTPTDAKNTSRANSSGAITAKSNTVRPISTTCEERNMRTVSTSELHRCTKSPVSALSKNAAGRLCSRKYSASRTRRAKDSDATAAHRPRKYRNTAPTPVTSTAATAETAK